MVVLDMGGQACAVNKRHYPVTEQLQSIQSRPISHPGETMQNQPPIEVQGRRLWLFLSLTHPALHLSVHIHFLR